MKIVAAMRRKARSEQDSKAAYVGHEESDGAFDHSDIHEGDKNWGFNSDYNWAPQTSVSYYELESPVQTRGVSSCY